MMCRKLCIALLILGFAVSIAQAGLITSIERRNSTNTAPQIAGPLAEGSLVFVDRTAATHPPGGHQYKQIPTGLLGADYVMVANSDRTVATYELDVTVASECKMFLFIDNRVGDNDKATPPTLGNGVMDWVGNMGFVSIGQQLSIDEKGDGSIDNYFTIYSKLVPAGTITLKEQNAGSLNMYGVAAPEPATIALLGLGALTLLRRRK